MKTSPIKAPAANEDIILRIVLFVMRKRTIKKKIGIGALEMINAPMFACCNLEKFFIFDVRNLDKGVSFTSSSLI